jgi:hypothetical protein
MTLKESPLTLIAIGLIIILKACTQTSGVTASEEPESQGTEPTEAVIRPTSDSDPSAGLTLKLMNGTGTLINKWLYGYNTANLFLNLSDEEKGVKLIKDIHPNILRFPGGTSANFYHFNGPGYGLKISDAETVAGFNAYKNTKSSAQKELEDVERGKLSQNYAQDMVNLCRSTGSALVLVTNHFTGSDEENLAMVEFFSKSGTPIAGVELGNEYYLKTYSDKFPRVQDYIKAVKPIALKLKKRYPEIPLAVVAAPNDEMKSMNTKRAEETAAWNLTLAKEDFYDGYVVHNYARSKNCDQMAMLPQRADCYITHNLELVQSTLPSGIEAYDEIFSPRKMWLTEWNVKEVFEGLGNTMLQAFYMAEHLMMLTDQDKVHLATYHNLLASGGGFNIIATNGKGDFYGNAAYHSAKLLNPLFNGDVSHLALNTIQKGDNRLLTTKAFQSSSERFLVVINQSPVQEIISLKEDKIENLKAEMSGFSAESPLYDYGQINVFNGSCSDLSHIVIPAFSINLIRLPQQ